MVAAGLHEGAILLPAALRNLLLAPPPLNPFPQTLTQTMEAAPPLATRTSFE